MVGFSISKQLQAQGHSVTVIDQSSEDIKKINDTQDVKGIVGRATLPSVLENAGAKDADMIIAVTRNDEINMIVCQIASSLFDISKKIARIRSQEFLDGKWSKLYSKSNIPIDVIISPEREVAKSLYRKLEAPGALDNVPFVKDKVKLLEISIDKGCPIINLPLKDLTKKFPEFKAHIFGAQRKDSFVFLKKDDVMNVGDKVYLVVSTDQINKLLSVFGHEEKSAQKILIIGGGNIGLHLAKLLEGADGLRTKIIEKNKSRAELLASELSSSIVICGDALDEKIYSQEQKRAWSSQAWNNQNFDKSIIKGKGWIVSKQGIIIAFATRYPADRIALFYCKGKFQRKGYGSNLLHKLEDEAKKEGLDSLYTEASLISYELFLKNEWKIIRKEKVIINNIFFKRYKMTKIIKNN